MKGAGELVQNEKRAKRKKLELKKELPTMPTVFYFFQYHHVYRLRGHHRIRKDNSDKTARSISREKIQGKKSPSRA